MALLFVILKMIIFCMIIVVFGCLVHKNTAGKEQEDLEQVEFLKRWKEEHSN